MNKVLAGSAAWPSPLVVLPLSSVLSLTWETWLLSAFFARETQKNDQSFRVLPSPDKLAL